MTSVEGVRMGLPSHPITRRVKPKPFTRPSTTVAAAPVHRDWRSVPARALACGDTVPGVGTLHRVQITAGRMIVTGGVSNIATWDADEPVFAFTAATA